MYINPARLNQLRVTLPDFVARPATARSTTSRLDKLTGRKRRSVNRFGVNSADGGDILLREFSPLPPSTFFPPFPRPFLQ